MNDSDKHAFKELLNTTSRYYGSNLLKNRELLIYWEFLAVYSIGQVETALAEHIKTPGSGRFFPKVADIIEHLGGGKLTAEKLIAAARLADTPLGVLCRITIGTWDLNNSSDYYLRQRAEACLAKVEEWKLRATNNQYTDHEISVMLKLGVDPGAPFYHGLPGPTNTEAIQHKALRVQQSKQHQLQIASPYTPSQSDKSAKMDKSVAGFVNQIMSD